MIHVFSIERSSFCSINSHATTLNTLVLQYRPWFFALT